MSAYLRREILETVGPYLSHASDNPLKESFNPDVLNALLEQHGDDVLRLCDRLRKNEIRIVDFNLAVRNLLESISSESGKHELEGFYREVKEKIDETAAQIRILLKNKRVNRLINVAMTIPKDSGGVFTRPDRKRADACSGLLEDHPRENKPIKKFPHRLGAKFDEMVLQLRLSGPGLTVFYYLAHKFGKEVTFREIEKETGVEINYLRVMMNRWEGRPMPGPYKIVKKINEGPGLRNGVALLEMVKAE